MAPPEMDPLKTWTPSLLMTAFRLPDASFTMMLPFFAKDVPPISSVPPFTRSAAIWPVVMKSATRFPSIVQAFLKVPLYPVVLNPIPFLFRRITFFAVLMSAVFMIRISSGCPSDALCIMTYPPSPPVIRFVALFTLVLIRSILDSASSRRARLTSAVSLADAPVKLICFPPSVIVDSVGSVMLMSASFSM